MWCQCGQEADYLGDDKGPCCLDKEKTMQTHSQVSSRLYQLLPGHDDLEDRFTYYDDTGEVREEWFAPPTWHTVNHNYSIHPVVITIAFIAGLGLGWLAAVLLVGGGL